MKMQLTASSVTCGAVALSLLAGASAVDAATIAIDSSATSAIFEESSATSNIGTMSYANNSDFLTVKVHAGSGDKDFSATTAPVVTYNGVTMDLVQANINDSRRSASVYTLANPATGTNDLTVTWGTGPFNSTGDDPLNEDGQWMFSAQSLSNVDHTSPIAAIADLSNNGQNTPDGGWSTTIESAFAGTISAGDLFMLAESLDSSNVVPDYHTPDSTVTGLYTESLSGRQAADMWASLLASDISNGDELVVTQGVVGDNTTDDGNAARKTGERIAVVYNAVPEPASLGLMGAGGLLLLARRRR